MHRCLSQLIGFLTVFQADSFVTQSQPIGLMTTAFRPDHPLTVTVRLFGGKTEEEKESGEKKHSSKGILDFIFNPYETKIPKELEKEIYQAEGNTVAAQDRTKRVGLYAVVAFSGILLAFFNGFITELRNGSTPDGIPFALDDAGFAWVESNFLTRFLFMNKVGGGVCLVGGAAFGLLAEAEFDTRRTNAEKIWEEMQRRREGKTKKVAPRKKKRRSGKESKRLGAIAEVAFQEREGSAAVEVSAVPKAKKSTDGDIDEQQPRGNTEVSGVASEEDIGVFGALKGFYEKADKMAASQALLLNKQLEEKGLLEKITDESGLKVIGKDEAAKLKSAKTEGDASNKKDGKS